jgi:hypothetical protein
MGRVVGGVASLGTSPGANGPWVRINRGRTTRQRHGRGRTVSVHCATSGTSCCCHSRAIIRHRSEPSCRLLFEAGAGNACNPGARKRKRLHLPRGDAERFPIRDKARRSRDRLLLLRASAARSIRNFKDTGGRRLLLSQRNAGVTRPLGIVEISLGLTTWPLRSGRSPVASDRRRQARDDERWPPHENDPVGGSHQLGARAATVTLRPIDIRCPAARPAAVARGVTGAAMRNCA